MSDDIVARLRDYHATVLAAPPYYRELTRIAADEIERLRRDYSAAEQDHVDAVVAYSEAEQEIERLRAELRTYTGDGHNTKGEPCTQNTPS
jgi:chromosome segregation ATPase